MHRFYGFLSYKVLTLACGTRGGIVSGTRHGLGPEFDGGSPGRSDERHGAIVIEPPGHTLNLPLRRLMDLVARRTHILHVVMVQQVISVALVAV